MTSHDMIYKIRKLSGEKRVGHAGTLDPLASGVLIVAIGREFTREISKIEAKEKEYIAEITLGQTSTTDDMEGVKEDIKILKKPELLDVQKILENFRGEIMQKPPIYSAIKISGKRAYELARKGESPEVKERKITIYENEIIDFKWPILKLRIVCSKGTYIRSIARDIGEELKTGGFLSALSRTRIGEYKIEDSLKV